MIFKGSGIEHYFASVGGYVQVPGVSRCDMAGRVLFSRRCQGPDLCPAVKDGSGRARSMGIYCSLPGGASHVSRGCFASAKG
jgi:hypothetical protein